MHSKIQMTGMGLGSFGLEQCICLIYFSKLLHSQLL